MATLRMNACERLDVVTEARRRLDRMLESFAGREGMEMVEKCGKCLPAAFCLCTVLKERGLTPYLQAGSASWPRVRQEQDDGVSPTHFSYIWEPEKAGERLALGILPEMHAWVALIGEDPEIIDITTHALPSLAMHQGMDWPGDQPPDYLWCLASRLPDRWMYEADRKAIEVAWAVLESVSNGRPLVVKVASR